MINSSQRETWRCKVRVIVKDWNGISGAKDLADMENIYKPAAECCIGIYVSIGILPGKVRRNSMKTKKRVLDANLDPGRSSTHLSSRLGVPDASCLQRY